MFNFKKNVYKQTKIKFVHFNNEISATFKIGNKIEGQGHAWGSMGSTDIDANRSSTPV